MANRKPQGSCQRDGVVSRKTTPHAVADAWGISPDKVVAWIRAGELRAINAATRIGSRPRYLIDVDDLAAFEAMRSIQPLTPTRRRRRHNQDVIEFF